MTDHANAGYRRLFGGDGLTVGLMAPLSDPGDAALPSMDAEADLAARAEAAGFDAVWARDVPVRWPDFGDVGQGYDPWTYLTSLAAHTDGIALATGSVALPVRHPLHVATTAAALDRLSDGRAVLGVGSGDRDPEYAAFGVDADDRGAAFRESVRVLRAAWAESFPELDTRWGVLDGEIDPFPKPTTDSLPLFVAGHARQSLEWIAEHADGWLFYRLPDDTREDFLDDWRAAAGEKPYVANLRVELAPEGAEPERVHQGFRAPAAWFRDYLRDLDAAGVDHLVVGLSAVERDPAAAIDAFAADVLDTA